MTPADTQVNNPPAVAADLAPPSAQPRSVPARLLIGVWRARGVWLGLIALGCALYGQRLVVTEQAVVPAIRWYAVGIILLILAWFGTYRNKSLLHRPVP